MLFDYEYYCGANIVIEIDGMIVTEAVAMQVELTEGKGPIYGYSSRHWDAWASGQVIVQGSLVVNYVHQDYLYRLMETAKLKGNPLPSTDQFQRQTIKQEIGGADIKDDMLRRLRTDFTQETDMMEALKGAYWDSFDTQAQTRRVQPGLNPSDSRKTVNIGVTFGERNETNNFGGKTSQLVSNVVFTGRGLSLQIDENVIVERYQFFARDIYSVMNQNLTSVKIDPETGDPTFTLG